VVVIMFIDLGVVVVVVGGDGDGGGGTTWNIFTCIGRQKTMTF